MLPINEDSLTNAQQEQMIDQLESLLAAHCGDHTAFIYPDSPRGTSVAVNTLEQLIDLSVYLGAHNMLFAGDLCGYDFYPAGTIDDEDRLELYVYNYNPIPNPILDWRLIFSSGGIDDPQQADLARDLIRSAAPRCEYGHKTITAYIWGYEDLCRLCMILMGTINRVDLSGFRILPPQV